MEIRRIAVIGAGLMGHSIAQEFACAGYEVCLTDVSEEALEHALESMRRNLRTLSEAGRLDVGAVERIPAGIRMTTNLADAVADADLVLEAIVEDLEVKRDLFNRLDELCREDAILASNTSSFMPSSLASANSRPERVLVAHYFNPAHLVPLVELVPSPATAPEVLTTLLELYREMGKCPVVVRREALGFIANRMQVALLREALSIVERGIATFEDVDAVVRNSFGRRLAVAGPFEIADLAGLDVYRAVSAALLPDIESSTEPSKELAARAARGEYGVKSGRGFYDWNEESAEELRQRLADALM